MSPLSKVDKWMLGFLHSKNGWAYGQWYFSNRQWDILSVQFSSVTLLCPTLYDTMVCSMPNFPVHHQLPELTQTHVIELVIPLNHLILCCPLLLPLWIFPSIRVFSNEIVLCIRWPKYWNFSFSIGPPMNTQELFPLGWTGWISSLFKGLSRVFSSTTVQNYQLSRAQLSL